MEQLNLSPKRSPLVQILLGLAAVWKSWSKRTKIVFSILALLLLGQILKDHKHDHDNDDLWAESSASRFAEDVVRNRLKSPSTAIFGEPYATRLDEHSTHFAVIGHFDAQNSFGAMLRGTYDIELEAESPTTETHIEWRVVSVDMPH